jgi:hypothetical protein
VTSVLTIEIEGSCKAYETVHFELSDNHKVIGLGFGCRLTRPSMAVVSWRVFCDAVV